jgi:ribokinase
LFTAYGGKGANQAVAAQRAGAHVLLVAKLGQDQYGQDYVHYLQQEGLDVSGLRQHPTLPSGIALITVDRRGHNQITVAPGANSALTADDLAGLEQHLQPGTVLLTQLEIPLTTVEAALRQAKAAGVRTILNPAPARPLPARFARVVDLLVPNEVEAAMLCGQPVRSLQQAKTAARLLQQIGYPTVVLTLGKNGVMYTVEDQVVHLPGCPVQATDTTAAGDTFVGYLGCALAAGHPLSEALRMANAAAAISVTRVGAQTSIPQRHEVQQFLAAQVNV